MTDLTAPAVVEDEQHESAMKRARELQALYIHTLVFFVFNLGLFLIDWSTGEGWWFQWPLLIWGCGLGVHILATVAPVFSDDWVERRAERIAAKRG